jgi:hypothetical protein
LPQYAFSSVGTFSAREYVDNAARLRTKKQTGKIRGNLMMDADRGATLGFLLTARPAHFIRNARRKGCGFPGECKNHSTLTRRRFQG